MKSESLDCPSCGCKRSRVKETRQCLIHGITIRVRVRECGHCKYQYRTKEVIDDDLVISRIPPAAKVIPSPPPPPKEESKPLNGHNRLFKQVKPIKDDGSVPFFPSR